MASIHDGLYKKIGETILKSPQLIKPHVKVERLEHLNFQKMKEMGMEKIIYAKYEKLSDIRAINHYDDIDVLKKHASPVFGDDGILYLDEYDAIRFGYGE